MKILPASRRERFAPAPYAALVARLQNWAFAWQLPFIFGSRYPFEIRPYRPLSCALGNLRPYRKPLLDLPDRN
jgi:hypothetical protein